MRLQSPGRNTSRVEVTQISLQGIWILIKGEEFFMTYEDFPWFQQATVVQIHHVSLLRGTHLRWPELDVDLHVDSLKNLEKYPLTYNS